MTELYGEGWYKLAACNNGDPDAMFVSGAAQNEAKRICRSCPVQADCLVEALEEREEFGVRGGLTERERRKLHRMYPQGHWREMVIANLAIVQSRAS